MDGLYKRFTGHTSQASKDGGTPHEEPIALRTRPKSDIDLEQLSDCESERGILSGAQAPSCQNITKTVNVQVVDGEGQVHAFHTTRVCKDALT